MTLEEELYEFIVRRGISFHSAFWRPEDHAAWEDQRGLQRA